jgi:nifR3 family TIM-barrel protein
MIKLGKLSLKTHVFQSPMADCTDIAFRLVARKLGLELAFTEMISAEALARENKRTLPLLRRVPGDLPDSYYPFLKGSQNGPNFSSAKIDKNWDRPLGAQLVGHSPHSMGKAAAMVEAMGFEILDLNFGCPVRKVTSPGAGSALLQRPDLAAKIFENVMTRVKKIPVTVKMRTGFTDPSGKEALCIARLAEEHGLSAVTVHGRTRAQGYTGKADWSVIELVKKNLKIPVFGNGDIFTPGDAKRMMETTGCDGVAIGRGALGNPWLYAGIRAVLSGQTPDLPSFEEKKRVALEHIRLEVQYEGEKMGVLQSRKIAAWYFKGCPNVAQLRNKINRASSLKEMTALIRDYGN